MIHGYLTTIISDPFFFLNTIPFRNRCELIVFFCFRLI